MFFLFQNLFGCEIKDNRAQKKATKYFVAFFYHYYK